MVVGGSHLYLLSQRIQASSALWKHPISPLCQLRLNADCQCSIYRHTILPFYLLHRNTDRRCSI
uniref:Uncharacterized protein n=1 Tax=Triticum urartu TaxID=4572 RepID=A0A8R7R5X5_TRIUA